LNKGDNKITNQSGKILLIEGIPGSGKTTLIKAIVTKYVAQIESIKTFICLSQSHTYHPVVSDEENFYASKEQNLKHLEKIFKLLHWNVSISKNKLSNKFFCIIDTLHITHCFRPGNISWTDIKEYDSQLADINCKLIFLKVLPETIMQRSILPRSKRDNHYLSKYQKRYGNTLEEVHQYYMNEQDKMENIIRQSSLTKIILHSEEEIQINADIAYNFGMGKDK
jgi:thymidylate kinase